MQLTADQKQSIQGLLETARKESEQLEVAVQEQQAKFESLLQGSSLDIDTASNQLKKLLDAESSVKIVRLQAMIKMRNVLTTEQKKKIGTLSTSQTRIGVRLMPRSLKSRTNSVAPSPI